MIRVRALVAVVAATLLLVGATLSWAGHTGSTRFPKPDDPNPRVGTPDDPNFDCSEPDDEDLQGRKCTSVFSEQNGLFGFPPASTRFTATYKDAARLGQGQVSGVSADRAWKYTIGSPEVSIAIIDTGIRWDRSELRLRIWLNRGELPLPQGTDGTAASDYDFNMDAAFNVVDYEQDPRVTTRLNAGPNGFPALLDGQDLIRIFFDGVDNDSNGFVDDIAGWDFFDDDNDPFDASSYSSANNHGSGRAEDAARETDNGSGGAGVCPRCQVMMLRAWDTFVVPGDNYAMATIYAADNGASVQEVALGVLQNTRFAQAATEYAFRKGVALMQVSSDLNTANHNYPTNYNNTVFVAGSVADTHGLGQDSDPRLADFLKRFGIGTQVPVSTWFRNSNLTQFGGHAHIVMEATTGSINTGQAAGAAGLVKSFGLQKAAQIGGSLSSNEVKQLLTLTAEDVVPENTVGLGIPDPSQPGWDEHFGYGRVKLDAALARIAPERIPPEAGIESPAWFMPLDPVKDPSVPIKGFASAPRASSFSYELAYAPGLEPLEAAFKTFATGAGGGPKTGTLGALPLSEVAMLLPGAAQGVPPVDPHQYAFTIRLRVRDNLGNLGEDRKTLFAYHDTTMHTGWPKFVDTGGETSLRFADLDGNGALEMIAANSSGEIAVYNHDGSLASYFNGGKPFKAAVPSFIKNHLAAPAFSSGALEPGRVGFSTPAVADLDRDGYPEVIAASGDRVYVLKDNGTVAPGFPVTINPAFSAPALRTKTNHLKTGIFSSPAIGDLDRDGKLDIVVAAMDQRAYAWNAAGKLLEGWPVLLRDPALFDSDPTKDKSLGAESINTSALADIDGDGYLDVIVATNEVYGASPASSLEEAVREGLLNLALGQIGVSSRLYAVRHDGTKHDGVASDDGGWVVDRDAFLPGWPVTLNGLTDLLPLVEPGIDAVVADVDPTSPGPEVINGTFTGDFEVIAGDGRARYALQSNAAGENPSPGLILNTSEYPAVGDPTGAGSLAIFKGGVPVEAVVNLLLVGQNIPFSHVVQGWEARTGQFLPGWPRATDDFQILSSPSIADVGGGPDREVIVGTGLYLLHAYGPTGVEPPGFPKFTGGWLVGVTPVGDLDGDGLLEIANWTKEGNLFVWDTTAPVCGGNSEWWGFRHDEHNTGLYGNDTRAPSPVLDLSAKQVPPAWGQDGDPGQGNGKGQGKGPEPRVVLSWTAPGDDTVCGTAASYEVRYATTAIARDNWNDATRLDGAPTPGPGGTKQTFAAEVPGEGLFYAIRSTDDAGNLSAISNSAQAGAGNVPPGQQVKSSSAGPRSSNKPHGFGVANALAALIATLASAVLSGLYILGGRRGRLRP